MLNQDFAEVSGGSCDKRLATYIDRFANVMNLRGEAYVSGQDALMTYPDAG